MKHMTFHYKLKEQCIKECNSDNDSVHEFERKSYNTAKCNILYVGPRKFEINNSNFWVYTHVVCMVLCVCQIKQANISLVLRKIKVWVVETSKV